MKAKLRALLVAVATELGAAVASAQPTIAIEHPDPGSCVDTAELARTLASARIHAERDDAAPAVVAPVAPTNAAGSAPRAPAHRKYPVSVTIAGTPEALRVTLHRRGSDSTELLPAATCASATDAVAAFLSSALGPPPIARPPVALDALERAIGDELARRQVQLALLGARLTLARDSQGNVSALLEHPRTPACTQNVALGVIDEATPENVRDATDVLAHALLTARPCPEAPLPEPPRPPPRPSDWAEPERARALSKALDRVESPRLRFGIGTVQIASGIGFAILTVAFNPGSQPNGSPNAEQDWIFGANPTKAQRTLVAFGNGVLLGGGIGTLAMGPDRGNDFGRTVTFTSNGLLVLGGFFGGSRFARQATGAGLLVSASLSGLNVARPTPLARLAADQQEVLREGLTRARARAIERDLEQADPFVPRWLVLTPAAVGASVAAIQTAAEKEHLDSLLFVLDTCWVLGYGITITVDAAQGSIPGSYRRALRGLGLEELSLAPGPGEAGLSLVGRF